MRVHLTKTLAVHSSLLSLLLRLPCAYSVLCLSLLYCFFAGEKNLSDGENQWDDEDADDDVGGAWDDESDDEEEKKKKVSPKKEGRSTRTICASQRSI